MEMLKSLYKQGSLGVQTETRIEAAIIDFVFSLHTHARVRKCFHY